MPYFVKGKCVYKKDGGAKVGCTKGSVQKYLAALHANANESEDKSLREARKYVRNILNEKFAIIQNTLEISEPYDNIETIKVGDKNVYVLFGNVDYYENKESILAIKRRSSELNLDHKAYTDFLKEFHKRFYSLGESKKADLVASIETTSPVTTEMASVLQIPFVKNGFRKNNPAFKMKDIDLKDRSNVKDLFSIDFKLDDKKVICVMDDFITSGMSFKNAFDKLPLGVESFGVCLFKLNS
jgi:hypothetical protein